MRFPMLARWLIGLVVLQALAAIASAQVPPPPESDGLIGRMIASSATGLDPSFGTQGKVISGTADDDGWNDMAFAHDGKRIVLAGHFTTTEGGSSNLALVVARVLEDGATDT